MVRQVVSQLAGGAAFEGVERAINALIKTLRDVNEIQESTLSIGSQIVPTYNKLSSTIAGHPGGVKRAFEDAVSLMQVGFFKHSAGINRLVAITRASGQNQKQLAQGIADLASQFPLSVAQMDDLAVHIEHMQRDWGIQTGALVAALNKNADTVSRVAALGGDRIKNLKAIGTMISQAGKMHEKTVGLLAERFAFKGGTQDLTKLILQLGNRQDLVQRVRTEDMTPQLLHDINKAILQTYDLRVQGAGSDRAIKADIAKQLGFDVEQIEAMRSLKHDFADSMGLLNRGLNDGDLNFSKTFSTLFDEFLDPIKTIMIPIADAVTSIVTGIKNMHPLTKGIFDGLTRFVLLFGAYFAFQRMKFIKEQLQAAAGSLKAIPLIGQVLGGVLVLGSVMHSMHEHAKAEEERKRRDEREKRRAAAEKLDNHQRFITGALIAASLTHQNEMLPLASDQTELLGRIHFALDEGNKDRKAGNKNKTKPVGG